MPVVRPLAEMDLSASWRIARTAFGTFTGAPDLDAFWRDRDLHSNRFRSANVEAFAIDEGGVVLGSNFATRWGSVGFFGPLTTRVDRWDGGLAQPLVAAACDAFDRWGVSHAGLFTFPHSTKHIHLYGKFGFHPRFLTAIMTLPAAAVGGLPDGVGRYSVLTEGERGAAEAAARALCDAIYGGLDLTGDIRAVAAQGIGDTLLLGDGDSRLAGFAVAHWGPASEAGEGNLYLKFAAVRGAVGASERFDRLIDGAAALAADTGVAQVLAGVNLAHEEAYRQMKARGFRTAFQGVTMHRGNEPGYSRPGVYVLDDWR
jgi:hypothetical protein